MWVGVVFSCLLFAYKFVSRSAEKKDGVTYKKGGTEIGKAMAEKSRGLFSADDWQCKR